jgi:hypothetical protein
MPGSCPELFGNYLSEDRFLCDSTFLPLLVEVKVLHLLRITTFLVPVPHQSFRSELTIEIRSLLDNKILVHET